MSITEPMAKARQKTDRQLINSPNVKPVFSLTSKTGGTGLAQMEIMLLEGALEDLHKHRDKIQAAGRNAVRSKRSRTKKFYRAVAKTRFATGIDVPEIVWISKNRMITIPEYKRQDGTVVPEHQRRLPEGHSASEVEEREDAIAEFEEAKEYQRSQEQRYGLDLVDGLSEKVFQGENAETYHGAISTFLNETSVGQSIAAVAGFFADQGSKFQFAARAINEFGPWAGTRLAYNYFRYGGYDVPMTEKNGKIRTEMGDVLPEVKSQKESRKWAIETLRKRLPGQSAEDSDAEPPSEGFLIDKDGNILAHGVGRGNDHFLPFNSRHLKRMREEEGVEYIRRRMYGGPTSEDLHAAMMMGADRLTVVSNGGEFIVELTRRSHGLKMEHMQVLSRFQNILDQKGDEAGLDFDGYNSALDTLQAEFPLHFNKAFAKRGAWGDREDRITPENRFVEGLRDIFNSLAGYEYEEETTTSAASTQRSDGTNLYWGAEPDRSKPLKLDALPWRRLGISQNEWMSRERKRRSDVEWIGEAVNSYRRAGLKPPQSWLEAQEQAKRKSERSGGQSQADRQRAAGQRALSPPTPRIDPTTSAAQSAQPAQARFTVPQRARERFEALGIDPAGYTTENTQHARELAQIANELPSSMWDETLTRDFLDDLKATFPNITRS